jgi:hypothetical protein
MNYDVSEPGASFPLPAGEGKPTRFARHNPLPEGVAPRRAILISLIATLRGRCPRLLNLTPSA